MTRRLLLALIAVLTIGALSTSIVGAQEEAELPAVEIDLAPARTTVQGGDAVVTAGAKRIVFRNTSRRAPAAATIVALKEGVTLARFRTALRRADRGPNPIKAVATFEGGGSVPPGGRYTTTLELKPNTTYVVASINEREAARSPLDTFRTGQQLDEGAIPAPDATVELYDYAFGMPSELPRNATVRFENQGERLHFALAFPVRRGQSRVAAVRAIIANNERRAGRLIDERRAFEPLGVVSGETTNDVEVRFPRSGDWLFVCFIGDGERGNPSHNTLGMVKAFSVR